MIGKSTYKVEVRNKHLKLQQTIEIPITITVNYAQLEELCTEYGFVRMHELIKDMKFISNKKLNSIFRNLATA